MNNNSNGSNKAKEEERLIWRKRLEEVLQHVRFDEVRIRKTERIETFEMQLGRRMASSGFRLSDQFDFSDEYVLWDLQKDQPASQNDQGRGISFEWEKEWLSTERLGQQYSEIWGILKTKTYSHGTMAAMNVGDILDSYGRVYRWKSAAFDPSSGSNGRPKQPYKAPPKPKNKRQQVNEQIASMKIIKQEMDIDVPQDQVIHDLTNAPSPSPSTSPLSSHTDALSESNDMTGNGAGFRYSPNGDIDLTMDEDGCVDLTASSPPIDLTEDEPTDYHANHGRRPSHEANAMRNEAGGRREPSPTNSLFDDDEEALSREREEQEERRTVTRTRMEDEALMNAQRANLFGTRDDATVNSVDGDVSGISSNITPKPGLTFPVIKKGRKRALDVTEESSIPSTSLDSTPTPASKRTKHLGHGKSSRTTTSLFTAVKGKAVVRDRTGVVRHFDVLSSAGTRLASDTASERAINAQLDQFNDRDRVTRAAAAPIAHTYGAYSGNPDDLEEYDEDEEMVDAEGQQSSTNGLSDLNQNVDNREGDRSLSPGADAIRKQKWGAVQPKEEPKYNPVNRPIPSLPITDSTPASGSTVQKVVPLAPHFLLRLNASKILRLQLCDSSGAQWQYHPLSKEAAIDRRKKARRGMVFGATEIERQYIHFDSPIRWFQHRVPLEQLAPQFHKLYQDQFKKSERVKEIKTELERDVSAVKVKLEGELRSLQSELQSIKNEDEPNETSPGNLPDLSDSTNVRPLVYSVDDAERLLSIPIPDQHIENPNAALGPGSGANTLEELKKVGGWCILEVMDLLDTDSEQERKAYQSLASWLRKNDKFLVITSSLVNKHYNNPHTLLIFSSQSTKMAEVEVLKSSGLPASLFGMKKRLVMVHIGRDIQIGRSEDRMRADRAEVLDLPVE